MGAFSRRPEIDRRRGRKEKILKLRRRYAVTKTEAERRAILDKVYKISPTMTVAQFAEHKAAKAS
jgi:hypothetical protein